MNTSRVSLFARAQDASVSSPCLSPRSCWCCPSNGRRTGLWPPCLWKGCRGTWGLRGPFLKWGIRLGVMVRCQMLGRVHGAVLELEKINMTPRHRGRYAYRDSPPPQCLRVQTCHRFQDTHEQLYIAICKLSETYSNIVNKVLTFQYYINKTKKSTEYRKWTHSYFGSSDDCSGEATHNASVSRAPTLVSPSAVVWCWTVVYIAYLVTNSH